MNPFLDIFYCCSVIQLGLILCDPMDCSIPGFPVLDYLMSKIKEVFILEEFAQSHVLWVGDAIQPFHPHVTVFCSCLHSFPASGCFPMSQLFASGGQSIRVAASKSVLPMNVPDRFPLGWTGWISLQFRGLSRVFSNTTVQKHQFIGTQLSSQSNSHIHTWLLEKS